MMGILDDMQLERSRAILKGRNLFDLQWRVSPKAVADMSAHATVPLDGNLSNTAFGIPFVVVSGQVEPFKLVEPFRAPAPEPMERHDAFLTRMAVHFEDWVNRRYAP